MKAISFLLTAVLFACTSNVQQETQTNTDTNNQAKYNIYLDDFEPSGFTYADFMKLQEIANKFPERPDTVPKDIAYRLTGQDTNDVEYYCWGIDIDERFPFGTFELRRNKNLIEFYVTFSQKGDILDYLVLKGAKIEKDKGKTKRIFFSDVTFFFCDDCYPETVEYFSVETLDTTKEAVHPDVAKVIKTDNWYINEKGKFKLKDK